MQLMVNFLKSLMVLCCGAACTWAPAQEAPKAYATGSTLSRIASQGKVVLGYRESSIPLSYVAAGKPMGYSIDVCLKVVSAVARHLKRPDLKVEFKPVTSNNRFDLIEKGVVDLECGSTTNSAVRRKRVAFTIAHFVATSRVLVKSSQPYSRIEDMTGKTVASTLGTTNIDSLKREAQIIFMNVVPSKDHAEGFSWVLSNKVDGFAMDDVLLFGLRASYSKPQDLKVIGKPMTVEPYALPFALENPDFKAVVDAELRRLISSRELYQMYDKWFLQPIPPNGINLEMRMSYLLAESFKFPTDFVPN
jgi:ABC-type amino acid transport substrate-binding protein